MVKAVHCERRELEHSKTRLLNARMTAISVSYILMVSILWNGQGRGGSYIITISDIQFTLLGSFVTKSLIIRGVRNYARHLSETD